MILGGLGKGYCKKNRAFEFLATILGQVASVPLKEEFKSRTKFDKFNIKKEEFYVFGFWLEIFKDQKVIRICVNKKELDEIY